MRLACLPIRSFTSRSELGDELEPVDVVTVYHVFDAFVERDKDARTLGGSEVVVHGHQLELRTFREVGRLVYE